MGRGYYTLDYTKYVFCRMEKKMRVDKKSKFTYWDFLSDKKRLKKSMSRLAKEKCFIDVEHLVTGNIRIRLWFIKPITIDYLQNIIAIDKQDELIDYSKEW